MATAARDEAGRHIALANLSAWRRQLTELKQVFSHGGIVTAVAFSPDGKTILTGSHDRTARLEDAATGRQVGQPMLHSGTVESVAFSPDGKTVLTGSGDNAARLWDIASGRSIGQPLPHPGAVYAVAFSPDRLRTRRHRRCRRDSAALGCRHYRTATRTATAAFGHGVLHRVQPPARRHLPDAHDNTAQLWNTATGTARRPDNAAPRPSCGPLLGPDGNVMLAAGWDKTARLWDAGTGRQLGQQIEHRDRLVRSVPFGFDGKSMSSPGALTIRLLCGTAATGQRIGWSLELEGERSPSRSAPTAGRSTPAVRTRRRDSGPAS